MHVTLYKIFIMHAVTAVLAIFPLLQEHYIFSMSKYNSTIKEPYYFTHKTSSKILCLAVIYSVE